MSGVIASEANFSKGDFKEVVMSKSYARVSKGNRLLLYTIDVLFRVVNTRHLEYDRTIEPRD